MKKLTICLTTSRMWPEYQWVFDSLRKDGFDGKIMSVDLWADKSCVGEDIEVHPPKPNPWQGGRRQTRESWWAKPNAINTALCLCKTEWILFLDDRCVVMPGFMAAVRDAMNGNYIMAGAYEKRTAMTVEKGVIRNGGIITGTDGRWGKARACNGEWLFGCVVLARLEHWLAINGSPEKCNGLGFEDVITGLLFGNNGFPMKFDERAKIVEDRTPEFLGTTMRRESKERHPHDTSDKAHTLLNWVRGGAKKSENPFDIRELRDRIQRGEPFPEPEPNQVDWFDQQPLSEMK